MLIHCRVQGRVCRYHIQGLWLLVTAMLYLESTVYITLHMILLNIAKIRVSRKRAQLLCSIIALKIIYSVSHAPWT